MKLKINTEIDMSNSAFDDYGSEELERILEKCRKKTLDFVNNPKETEVRIHLSDSNGNKVGFMDVSKEGE